jgi:hypothetical protein
VDIRAEDPAAVITGNVIIGNGDFNDDNVANTIKLDATFANNVLVTNTPAQRVPVTLDLTQQMKLDPSTIINTTTNTMAYTNSYASTAASVANTAIQMLAPATNVNGVVLNKFEALISNAAGGVYAVIAKRLRRHPLLTVIFCSPG